MMKIMIVDDEFYFREALKISIPWNELGFEICCEAKNGRDALEKLTMFSPEIILVDINMPIMDGLEFVQNARDAGINSKVIILTGHSEFNYAKQAVSLGVNNYILKPVNEDELMDSLLEMKNIIEKEKNIRIEVDRLKQQVRESLPLLKDKFLNELLQGHLIREEETNLKKMEYLNINVSSDYYLVVTIELDYEDALGWNNEDKQLWKFAVSNVASEILGERFVFDICCDIDDRICMIIGGKEVESSCDVNALLESRLELVRNAIHKYLGFTITIGVGTEKNILFDIAASYKESIVALKNKLVIGKNKVIFYSSVAESGIKGNLFTVEHRSQLLMHMRIADDTEVRSLISRVFEAMRKYNIQYEQLFVVCIEMASVCLEYVVEVGLSIKDILPGKQMNLIEQIQSKKSIDEMEAWIKEIYGHTLDIIKKNKSSKASKLIEQVKAYIRDNYSNDELSIDEIAKSMYVNYAHLCFVFKRDTGITINEFLTELRIKKAKELFDSGSSLIINVASRVGYADSNYFGKCFKKYYGLTPSRYLENIKGKNG